MYITTSAERAANAEGLYECLQCGTTFKSRAGLGNHKRACSMKNGCYVEMDGAYDDDVDEFEFNGVSSPGGDASFSCSREFKMPSYSVGELNDALHTLVHQAVIDNDGSPIIDLNKMVLVSRKRHQPTTCV
jgi:hypothetical protein